MHEILLPTPELILHMAFSLVRTAVNVINTTLRSPNCKVNSINTVYLIPNSKLSRVKRGYPRPSGTVTTSIQFKVFMSFIVTS